MVSETRYRIAEMTAEHYQQAEEFQRKQAGGLADVLMEIIIALDVPVEENPEGKTLLFGTWSTDGILRAVKEAAART